MKKENKKELKKENIKDIKKPFFKKRYIIYIVAFLLVVMVSLFLIFFRDDIKLKDDLTVEINNKVKLLSFINMPKKDKVLTEDELIDTSKLGDIKLRIEYLNVFNKKKTLSFKVKIVDTIKPEIECEDTITSEVYKNDIEGKIKISDNSGEEIKPTIEGTYDPNVEGEYKVKIVAVDNSGNKSTKDVTISIVAPSLRKYGYYVSKPQDAWYNFSFKEDNTLVYNINYCPGMGCGMVSLGGTYTVEGNKLTVTFTYQTDESGPIDLPEPKTYELTIKTEDMILFNDSTYNYQDIPW